MRMASNWAETGLPSPLGSAWPVSQLLHQAGYADHEELVHVGEQDGQEFGALKKRVAGVLGFFENPPLEGQQAQLPVEIETGVVQRKSGDYSFLRSHGLNQCSPGG